MEAIGNEEKEKRKDWLVVTGKGDNNGQLAAKSVASATHNSGLFCMRKRLAESLRDMSLSLSDWNCSRVLLMRRAPSRSRKLWGKVRQKYSSWIKRVVCARRRQGGS